MFESTQSTACAKDCHRWAIPGYAHCHAHMPSKIRNEYLSHREALHTEQLLAEERDRILAQLEDRVRSCFQDSDDTLDEGGVVCMFRDVLTPGWDN